MHNHDKQLECGHITEYCKECDIVYCKKCEKEWNVIETEFRFHQHRDNPLMPPYIITCDGTSIKTSIGY